MRDAGQVELFFGVQDEQLQGRGLAEAAGQYGWTPPNSVLAQLSTQNAIESASVVRTQPEEFPLRECPASSRPSRFCASCAAMASNPVSGPGARRSSWGRRDITRSYVDPAAFEGPPPEGQGSDRHGRVDEAKGGDIIRLGERLQGAMKKPGASCPPA